MGKIVWEDSFSIGNEDLDQQHKRWIEIYNTAHDQMMSGEDTADVGRNTLKKMIEYCKYHFSFEEKYMEKIGFSGFQKHQRIHDNFYWKLDRLLQQLDQGNYIFSFNIKDHPGKCFPRPYTG